MIFFRNGKWNIKKIINLKKNKITEERFLNRIWFIQNNIDNKMKKQSLI